MSELDAVSHARALNEKRMRAWEEGKRLLDDCARQNRDMLASERREWEKINAEIDRLDQERDVYLRAEQREREAATLRDADFRSFGVSGVSGRDHAEAHLLRTFLDPEAPRTILRVPFAAAAKERELLRDGVAAHEARALAWDTGSIASTVPVTTARALYGYLEASTAMFRAPCTRIVTSSGEQMKFPRFAAHAIATQVSGQGTTLAGTDPTFASMTLDSYKYGELVKIASEVISDSVIDVGAAMGRDLGRALGRKIDTDLVTGTGSGQPNGIMTAYAGGGAGSVTTGGSLVDPTYEKLVDVMYGINDEFRMTGSAGWLMRDNTAAVIRKIRDGAGGTLGAAMWIPSSTQGLAGGEPDTLFGFPVYRDPNVASLASNSRSILFSDFSAYYVRTVGDTMIELDTSRYFDTDEVGVRAKLRCDGDLIDVTAGCTLVRNV